MAMEPLSKARPKGFFDRLDGWNSAISGIPTVWDLTPQGCAQAAERAKAAVGQRYPYSLLDFNCHRFTARCVTGDSCPDIWLARHLDSFRKGTDGAYGNDESQPLQANVTGQGERLIRLTMALFYGQTISVRYIIRQFDVSPGQQDGTSPNWPLCGIRWPSPLATGSLLKP